MTALTVLIIFASVQCVFAVGQERSVYKYETITDLLGITRSDIVKWLTYHENDDYYLGTPYAYRTGEVVNDKRVPFTFSVSGSQWGLWPNGVAVYPYIYSPNGDITEGGVAQMNCGGFVHHVLTHATNKDGTEDKTVKDQIISLEKMYDPTGMGFAGAYSFYLAMYNAGVRTYYYQTIDEMLESEILEKGDIIILDGIGYYGFTYDQFHNFSDWHVGFFWGDDPSDNVFWHSGHQTLGLEKVKWADGTEHINPAYIEDVFKGKLNDPANKEDDALYGNIITEIKPASEYVWAIVVKFGDGSGEESRPFDVDDWDKMTIWQMLDDAWYNRKRPEDLTGWKQINAEWYYFNDESIREYYLGRLAEKQVFTAFLHDAGSDLILKVFPVLLDKISEIKQ